MVGPGSRVRHAGNSDAMSRPRSTLGATTRVSARSPPTFSPSRSFRRRSGNASEQRTLSIAGPLENGGSRSEVLHSFLKYALHCCRHLQNGGPEKEVGLH